MGKRLLNLRIKTVFDFSTNEKWLATQLIGHESKQAYIDTVLGNSEYQAETLLAYAQNFGDKELENAVLKEFATEIHRLFNE